MHIEQKPVLDAAGLRLAVAVSSYHAAITGALRAGAIEAFVSAGGRRDDLLVVPAPGSFELTAICGELARGGEFDALVALGCVISGETTHDQYICQAVAHGLTSITVQTGVPIGFGLLTCRSLEQARARAGGDHGNKGTEAMSAAIATVLTIRQIQEQMLTAVEKR